METFKANKINQTPVEDVKNEYLSFYNQHLNHLGINVFFKNVSYTNGMSVYIAFTKQGSEDLVMRHSDHENSIGYSVYRGTFNLNTNGTLLPTMSNVNRVIEILEKYKD